MVFKLQIFEASLLSLNQNILLSALIGLQSWGLWQQSISTLMTTSSKVTEASPVEFLFIALSW